MTGLKKHTTLLICSEMAVQREWKAVKHVRQLFQRNPTESFRELSRELQVSVAKVAVYIVSKDMLKKTWRELNLSIRDKKYSKNKLCLKSLGAIQY